jgi:Bax protein
VTLRQPLKLRELRLPRTGECLFWGKSLLLGAILPAWIAVSLAVTTGTGRTVTLGGSDVSGVSLRGTQLAALRQTFDRHDFDLEAVARGNRSVPPLFVRNLPDDWRDMRAKARKRAFVKTVLPLVLKANARIRAERAQLLRLIADADGDPATLSDDRQAWLHDLARRYGTEADDLTALKRRVDVVPVSLALAQAANESAWGTSRFARKGNALFGQWTWEKDDGIAPKEPQHDKGDYAVRAFDSLGDSVAAYMQNLNTHAAYAEFRARRAHMRKAGDRLDSLTLAAGLLKYSERGEAYVEEIRAMIRHNRFRRLDSARLASDILG